MQLLDKLLGLDVTASRFPIETFDRYAENLGTAKDIRNRIRAAIKSGDRQQEIDARDALNMFRKDLSRQGNKWFVETLLRWTWTDDPLRERFALFWFDHFTARGKNGILAPAGFPFIEDAIRPNVAGRFGDLLTAAVTHPLMLHYLDQSSSRGPNSKVATQSEKVLGLNENLAREVLELHSLGVGGPYDQKDVRQLAELFAGLTHDGDGRFVFRPQYQEPGPEIILGREYGLKRDGLAAVHDVLQDIARHPSTAEHIARKLAVHFVSDTPDTALITDIATCFTKTDGDLSEVYAVLMDHPASRQTGVGNVKPPFDLVASACRALAVDPDHMRGLTDRDIRRWFLQPLRQMGQPLLRPDGPDGWPESDSAWITPQGLSARLRWAVSVPQNLCAELPDPVDFVQVALGNEVPAQVGFAAGAAESRSDAIGLVLTSPTFQRR